MKYNGKCLSDSLARKRIIWLTIAIIGILLMTFGGIGIEVYQQAKKAELEEEYAYKIGVVITLQEDLLQKYGVTPQDAGLEDLRQAWIDNPCSETANAYNEALSDFVEDVESKNIPDAKLMAEGTVYSGAA